MRLVPSKRSGSSAIRVRTLSGTRDTPAGIPLDGGGLGHAEQERGDGFDDFQSIEVEFDCEEGKYGPSFLPFLASEHRILIAVELVANTAVAYRCLELY